MNNSQDLTVKCNLLLAGKAGPDKMNFVNCLFGADKFQKETGATNKWEEIMQQYSLIVYDHDPDNSRNPSGIQGFFQKLFKRKTENRRIVPKPVVKVNAYDAIWPDRNNPNGLMENLDEFLSANETILICFYVINCVEGCIEPNEISMLKMVNRKHKIPVSAILTDCDIQGYEDKLSAIEAELKKENIESIHLCSVSGETGNAYKADQSGRELALKKLLEAFHEKVGKELSVTAYKRIISYLRDTQTKIAKKIDDSDLSVFQIKDMESTFDSITDDLDRTLDQMDITSLLSPAYADYHDFVGKFDVEYKGRNSFEKSFDEISDFAIDFDIENIGLETRLEKALENIEDGNVLEKIGGALTVAGTVLFIKSNIKDAIAEVFDQYVSKLNSQLLKMENVYSLD
jgi:hypothetical protein